MNIKPIRTTIVFGLVSAMLLFALVGLFTDRWGWPSAFKLALWADLSIYCLLQVRWSNARLPPIFFPWPSC